jgi:5-methylcytosine-specific restriction endonuclease McrA
MMRTDSRAWARLRSAIAAAHMGEACPYCHAPVLAGQLWELDHATPVKFGGTDQPGNLRLAHRSCNRRAGLAIARLRIPQRPVTHARDW